MMVDHNLGISQLTDKLTLLTHDSNDKKKTIDLYVQELKVQTNNLSESEIANSHL